MAVTRRDFISGAGAALAAGSSAGFPAIIQRRPLTDGPHEHVQIAAGVAGQQLMDRRASMSTTQTIGLQSMAFTLQTGDQPEPMTFKTSPDRLSRGVHVGVRLAPYSRIHRPSWGFLGGPLLLSGPPIAGLRRNSVAATISI